MQASGPNCFKCRHFIITWQIKRAYGCRAMGFRSQQIPSHVVRQTTGQPCALFTPKRNQPKAP